MYMCLIDGKILVFSDSNEDKAGLSEDQNDQAAEFDPLSLNECQNNIKTEPSEDQNDCNYVKMEEDEEHQGFCVPEEEDSVDSEQGSQLSGMDLKKPFNDIHKWVLLQYKNLTLKKIM